jgi:hypothetical protein
VVFHFSLLFLQMPSSSESILDHIAEYLKFISDAQLFWFTLNTSYNHVVAVAVAVAVVVTVAVTVARMRAAVMAKARARAVVGSGSDSDCGSGEGGGSDGGYEAAVC